MKRFGQSNGTEDLSVSCENLNRLEIRQDKMFGSRTALLRELAYSICRGGDASADEIRSNYSKAFPSHDISGSYFDGISANDKIEVCLEIASFLGKENSFLRAALGQGEPCPMGAREKISYVKNNFTDLAYLSFSKLLHAPRFAYSDSFETMCEDVFSGVCEFCILPIETSSDGRLFSFFSLIDRYELRTSAVCTVERDGGASFTRFALLKRSFSDELQDIIDRDDPLLLELRISHPSSMGASINTVFRAADVCSMPLYRVDSLPLPYGDSLISHYAVFGICKEKLYGFLTYLSLEFPQCYVAGIYSAKNN